jgi:hypothetical protein
LVVTGSFSSMVRSAPGRSSAPRRGSPGAQVAHAHQVFLFHHRVFADELARHAAVLCEHQQADGVDVEPPGRRQATQLRGVEEKARVVVAPAVLRGEQRHGGFMPVLGLAADVPDRLVQQDGDLRGLLALGFFVHLDAVGWFHLQPHGGDLPIDLDPALGDPVVGLAARAQAALGHAFVQADGVGGPGHPRERAGRCGRTPDGAGGVGGRGSRHNRCAGRRFLHRHRLLLL